MEQPKIGVFIGRFQPLHNAHVAAIWMALNEVDHLVVVLGSACNAKTVRNPWTTQEREDMLRYAFPSRKSESTRELPKDRPVTGTDIYINIMGPNMDGRISVVHSKDYLYNDNQWLAELQSSLSRISRMKIGETKDRWIYAVGADDDDSVGCENFSIDDCDVTLYGHNSGKSKSYLKQFPNWKFKDVGDLGNVSGARIREMFFRKDITDIQNLCPETVVQKLKNEIGTIEYERLYAEFQHIEEYKQMWSSSPFPPTFVTTDAVLIKSGHVLVVRRRGQLGKGLLALPGGFIRSDEFLIDACIRELKEETQIKLPKDELKKRVKDQRVFDHPDRSLRGRTITHAFCMDLGNGDLPKVKGDDDADKAFWMPLRDVFRREEDFFEDHFHIIAFFCNRF